MSIDFSTFGNNIDSERYYSSVSNFYLNKDTRGVLSNRGFPGSVIEPAPYSAGAVDPITNTNGAIYLTENYITPAIAFLADWKHADSYVLTYFQFGEGSWAYEDATPPVIPWTPAEISTSLWLDGKDATTVIDGGGSLTWEDKSGNGRDSSQSSNPPVYSSESMVFSGTEFLDIATGLTISDNMAVFSVFERDPGLGLSVILGGTTTSAPPYSTYWDSGVVYSGLGSSGFTTHGASSSTGTQLHSLVRDVSSVELWQNGSTVGGSKTSLANSGSADLSYVGRRAGNYHIGKIKEIVVISSSVSQSTREKMEGYLAHKWGLTSNLPSGHPYKNEAPTV